MTPEWSTKRGIRDVYSMVHASFHAIAEVIEKAGLKDLLRVEAIQTHSSEGKWMSIGIEVVNRKVEFESIPSEIELLEEL